MRRHSLAVYAERMDDLRLELRTRNNVLWHAIFDVAGSVAEFCRRFNLDQSRVGGYLNLTTSPYGKMALLATAVKLCAVTGLGKDILFPVNLYDSDMPTPRYAIEVSSSRFTRLRGAHRLSLPAAQYDRVVSDELSSAVADAIGTLTPREQLVIRDRFGIGNNGNELTLEEVGNKLGINRERVRQIEAKALRKLRHPRRSRKLESFVPETIYESKVGWSYEATGATGSVDQTSIRANAKTEQQQPRDQTVTACHKWKLKNGAIVCRYCNAQHDPVAFDQTATCVIASVYASHGLEWPFDDSDD